MPPGQLRPITGRITARWLLMAPRTHRPTNRSPTASRPAIAELTTGTLPLRNPSADLAEDFPGRIGNPNVPGRRGTLPPLQVPCTWGYIRLGEGGRQVAQKVSVTFACDYDSKEIPEGEHLTRAFSLDGRDYEIDLCERHSQKFDEVLSRFAERARKVTGRVTRTKRRTAAHRQRSAEIRAWAKRSGMEVSDRGRIPAHVIKDYEETHR
jgi:hypothetical protein